MRTSLASLLLLACASNTTPGPGSGSDSGSDPHTDSGSDTGSDSGSDSGSGTAPDPDPDSGTAPDAGTDAAPAPTAFSELDDVSLYVVVGDSIAAGYNASGRNGEGGHGFARLLYTDFHALFPAARFERVAESGATSGESLANLRDALRSSLPASVPGDVVVSIHVGGNDFNDDVRTIVLPAATTMVAAQLRSNVLEMIALLRERYDDEAAGKTMLAMVHDVHDPTDGMGSIPPGFDEGFCSTLQNPLLATVAATALANLDTINSAIADAVAENNAAAEGNAVLVDQHDRFIGHGMNALGTERWLSNDCAHPNDEGHHQIRVAAWDVIGGP